MTLPAHEYLDWNGIEYESRTFPETTEKGASNVARALGFRDHQMVKTLIFQTGKKEVVLVMVGGDRSAVLHLVEEGRRGPRRADRPGRHRS